MKEMLLSPVQMILLSFPGHSSNFFQVQLTFDQHRPFFDLIGDNVYVGFEQTYWIDSYNALVTLNYGNYDFICHFPHASGADGTYIKPIEISKEVLNYSFNINDAKNVVSVTGLDNNGESLAKYDIFERKNESRID